MFLCHFMLILSKQSTENIRGPQIILAKLFFSFESVARVDFSKIQANERTDYLARKWKIYEN